MSHHPARKRNVIERLTQVFIIFFEICGSISVVEQSGIWSTSTLGIDR
jgi:hypothetical protein